MTTNTNTPPLALDEVRDHLDAAPTSLVGAVLGLALDAPHHAQWWTASSGPLEIVSATGAGRTNLARSVAAQLVREAVVDTVTVIGQAHEWAPLVDACEQFEAPAVHLVADHDHDEVAETLADLAQGVRLAHTHHHRDGRPVPDRSRVLVWDDPARTLDALHRSGTPMAYHAAREALALIRTDGPGLGVHTVTTHTPHTPHTLLTTAFPVRRAVAGLSRAQADRVLPGATAPTDHPRQVGLWHVADHAAPGAAAPVLVQAPHLTDGPDLDTFLTP